MYIVLQNTKAQKLNRLKSNVLVQQLIVNCELQYINWLVLNYKIPSTYI